MEVDELAKKIDAFAKETREDLELIKRGVYGDPHNKVRGLLERQDSDEQRIDKIERRQWKIGVIMGAGVAAVDFIIMYVKNFTK